MGLRSSGSYATVWAVEDRGKYSVVELSISKKNKMTDEWETDFSTKFARFIGVAHDASTNLKPKDRIRITEFEVTNRWDKERNTLIENLAVFKFENPNAEQGAPSVKAKQKPVPQYLTEDILDDEDVCF